MKAKSRIQNAIKNVGVASIMQIITLVLSFVSRTIFVRLLGNDYLSCDGLFANILTILSFSELGIGSAIIYSLYKPIEEEDRVKIGKLMNLLSVAYKYIALVISIVGICLIPFLKYLVTDVPNIKESITVLYCLFLANTVSSYIWGYKRSFLIANQENYIVLLIQQGINVLRILLQIVLLYATHNYVLFLVVSIICTLITNILSTVIADRKYPWLREYQIHQLTREERQPIFSNIAAIVQYKLGSVVLNGTDNILISVCLKTAYVGLCSNYNLIINAVTVIVNQACSGLQATVGNYNVSSAKENRYRIFKQLYFISYWVFGICTICLGTLLNSFIKDVWLGDSYVLPFNVVLALVVSFYISMINTIPSTYRTTMGYFKEARRCPLYAAVLNIFFSIMLSKIWGLAGIFFATAISRMLTFNIVDPYHVFTKGFNQNVANYCKTFLGYSGILAFNFVITNYVVGLITISGVYGFVIKGIICIICCNFINLVIFYKTSVFASTKMTLINYVQRRKH